MWDLVWEIEEGCMCDRERNSELVDVELGLEYWELANGYCNWNMDLLGDRRNKMQMKKCVFQISLIISTKCGDIARVGQGPYIVLLHSF
jgi:hypothetical protein